MYKKFLIILAAAVLAAPIAANATLLKISATTGASTNLGYFVVDTAVLATDTSLVASQFVTYNFTDPGTGISLNTGNVTGDTGVTFFGLSGSTWTVVGGGGDSLTSSLAGLWIAGTSFMSFEHGSAPTYSDVRWTTTDYSSEAPEPASLALLGLGFAGLVASRRRKQ